MLLNNLSISFPKFKILQKFKWANLKKIRFRHFKLLLPQSFWGRSLLILITPLILLQIMVGYIFFDRHTETILNQLASTIAGDVALVIDWVEQDLPMQVIERNSVRYLKLNIKFGALEKLDKYGAYKDNWLYGFMTEALNQYLKRPYYLYMSSKDIFIAVEIANKGLLKVSLPRKRLFSRTTPLVIIWSICSAILLIIVAAIFMRNQIKPLGQLAKAADALGRGQDPGVIKIYGALEIRTLARIFNIMRARIFKHLQERTQMLAGVSHDLRTLITRMQLQLALLPEDQAHRSLGLDVRQMQQMVEGFLSYAKGSNFEHNQAVPIASYIQNIIENWHDKNFKINFDPHDNPTLNIKPNQFNRCLTNIILNSNNFAKNCWITIKKNKTELQIIIEDDGPGINKELRNKVFVPFYRQDNGRNLDSGGVGLGLSIVKDVVNAHGGKIKLSESNFGGLKVLLTFPRL